jgi:dolichol-phosphate hexosyltransferase
MAIAVGQTGIRAYGQERAPFRGVRLSPELANVLLVIPALNEEAGLRVVLAQARELGVATLVLDGGSSDRSVEVAEEHEVEVLHVRRGKGRAWQDFLDSVPYDDWEYVAMVDADGSYDLSALPRLVQTLPDMAVGMRCREPGSTPLHRLLGGSALTWAASLITLRRCPDVLSGFRVIRSDCLRRVPFESEEFGLEAEMTIEFLRRGYRLSWVPCAYLPRYGESKLRPLRDGIDILRTMLRTRLRRL